MLGGVLGVGGERGDDRGGELQVLDFLEEFEGAGSEFLGGWVEG